MSEHEPSDGPADSSPEEHHVVLEKENENDLEEHDAHLDFMNRSLTFEEPKYSPANMAQDDLVKNSTPSTELEIALYGVLDRKNAQIERQVAEIVKLRSFVQKRKQTYKRKRRDDGAPRRALSGYNIFIKERFAELQKNNDHALRSDDSNAELKRVPPANLVTKTGNEWKALPAHIKKQYDERAKADRKRYEEEMAEYNPPDKNSSRKRNKTGYNMFFSSHVLRLKQTESGVPSERGSVARMVGSAWKQLSQEEKLYYEREADKHNGANPPLKDDEDEEEEEKVVHHVQMEHQQQYAAYQQPEMHMHAAVAGMHQGAAQYVQHDPRTQQQHQQHHGYYAHHVYAPNPYAGHYDYSQHHQRQPQGRAAQQQHQQYQYPPTHSRNPYDHMGL